jgi:hypothetical protein
MIDPIEKFFQIKVNYPFVALRNVLLRLGHGVMRRSTRSKPVAALGKRSSSIASAEPASPLVDEAIQHGWDAKLSHPSIRFRDFHPPHRFGFVGPVQQFLPNGRPVLLQIVAKFAWLYTEPPTLRRRRVSRPTIP